MEALHSLVHPCSRGAEFHNTGFIKADRRILLRVALDPRHSHSHVCCCRQEISMEPLDLGPSAEMRLMDVKR